MYQIIDYTSRYITWEGENLNKAMEYFKFLQGDFEPNAFINTPDIDALVLQKAERIDKWEREDRRE
jgi:hypothetical protein